MMEDMLSLFLLLGFGFVSGLRHGIDVDHIAAITDIVSSQPLRSRGLFYSTLYALGHGVMIVVLGLLVITVGQSLPESVDRVFGKIVGITLILLGLYVIFSIFRQGRNFTMQSRYLLVFSAIQFGYHKLLHNFNRSHHHPKVKEEKYAAKSAFGIGIIHGAGAETPTQVAALVALLGIGGGLRGILFLSLFVLGIFISNLVIAIFSSFGFEKAKQKNNVYLAIGFLTAFFSLVVGVIFLLE